jgi:glycosyltransferase involved in cell wall biosynthesis
MSLDIGGTEKHLSLIAPRLKERGWHPIVFCLWRRGQLASALEKAGVEVMGRPASEKERRLGLSNMPALATSWMRLMILVLRRRPQIMHFYLPLAYMLGAPIAIFSRVPVKVMSRRSLNVYQRKMPAVSRIERWLHARMTAVLGNSKQVVHELVEQEHCPPDKVGLIYNGTDLSAIAAAMPPDLSTLDIPAGSFVLTMVANLIPYKGHADLLSALGHIASQMPQPWHLLCIGRDQGYGPQLHDQAAKLGLEKNVHFLGERTDVPQLLKAADIGVLSSHEEGFSNAVVEGLAAGLPMIVTDVGGNAEAVTDGETGLVVPPRDPSALGGAILQLASNPQLRSRMADAALVRAAREFTIESCVEKYDHLYRGLLNGQCPGQIDGVGVTQ